MKITDEMEAQVLFYDNTLDCEDHRGMSYTLSIFMPRPKSLALMKFSSYYDLEEMFNTQSKLDHYRLGDLKVFIEWYRWQKSLPMPTLFYLEKVGYKNWNDKVVEEKISIKEALFLSEEYSRIGTNTIIKRMEDIYA